MENIKGDLQGRSGRMLTALYCERPDRLIMTADRAMFIQRGREKRALREFERSMLAPMLDDPRFKEFGSVAIAEQLNAYVNTGLNNSLDREFGLGGAAISNIGLDTDTTAVTATTTFLHGSSTTATPATTLNGAVSAGATTFVVTSATGIQIGMGYTIAAGGGTIESGYVANISGTTVTVGNINSAPQNQLQFAHANGTAVSFIGASIKTISPAATRSSQTTTGGATWTNSDFAIGGNNAPFNVGKTGFLNTATDAGTGLIDVIGGSGGTAPYNRPLTITLATVGTFSMTLQISVTAIAV